MLLLLIFRLQTAQNQFREVAAVNVAIKNRLQQTDQQLKKAQEEKKKVVLQSAIAKHKLKTMQTQVTKLEVLVGSAELEKSKQLRKLQDATKRLQRFADRSESCSKFRKAANMATVKAAQLQEQLESVQIVAEQKAREVVSLKDEILCSTRQHERLEKQNAQLRTKVNLFKHRQVSVRGHRKAENAAVSRANELGEAIDKINKEHNATVVRLQKQGKDVVGRLKKERDDAVGRLKKERDDAVARLQKERDDALAR